MVSTVWRLLVVAACLGTTTGGAAAQSSYCERLRSDLAAMGRSADPGRLQSINAEMARQRAELGRTVSYGRSIGCGRRQFLIFGEPPPPECGPIEAKINRMEAALASLDAQAERLGGGGAERASLQAAYEANCRGDVAGTSPVRQPGLLERLFGGEADTQSDAPPEPIDVPPEQPSGPGGTFKTICVRKCDGFFFPISQVANQARVEGDTALCQASCPNAEVELFMQPIGREVDAAVAADGTSYTALPNAFAYRKAVNSSCTCRKDGQSWVQTLGEAEQLMGQRPTDVTVTEQTSQDMAKPLDPPKGKQAKAPKGKPPAAPGQPQPAQTAADASAQAAIAAAAPTAGTQSSGIGGGHGGTATLGIGQGETREITLPNGQKRTVRVVAPTLGPDIAPQ